MKKESKWAYTTLKYQVMEYFDISVPDFQVLDYIGRMASPAYSSNGWCTKSILEMSKALRISESTVKRSLLSMKDKGLLILNDDLPQLRNTLKEFIWACDHYESLPKVWVGQNEPSQSTGQNELGQQVKMNHEVGQNDLGTPIYINNKNNLKQEAEVFDADKAQYDYQAKKINSVYDMLVNKGSIMQEELCMNLSIDREYYFKILYGFNQIQLGIAQTGTIVKTDELVIYWRNFVRTQSELGPKSVYHPDYKKVIDSKNPLPVVESAKPQEEEESQEVRHARMKAADQKREALEADLRIKRPELFDDEGKRLPAHLIQARKLELDQRQHGTTN